MTHEIPRGKIIMIWERGHEEIARKEWEGYDLLRLTRRVQMELRTNILKNFSAFMRSNRDERTR